MIPNKAFQALACGTPLVTADTPAARELLRDGESALLVPPGDPEALAAAVRGSPPSRSWRRASARGGLAAYQAHASEDVLGARWRGLVEQLVRPLTTLRSRRLAAAAFATVFGTASILRHRAFGTGRFDLGNMTQAVWSTANGDFLSVTDVHGEQISRLGSHFDPILAALRSAVVGLAGSRAPARRAGGRRRARRDPRLLART